MATSWSFFEEWEKCEVSLSLQKKCNNSPKNKFRSKKNYDYSRYGLCPPQQLQFKRKRTTPVYSKASLHNGLPYSQLSSVLSNGLNDPRCFRGMQPIAPKDKVMICLHHEACDGLNNNNDDFYDFSTFGEFIRNPVIAFKSASNKWIQPT